MLNPSKKIPLQNNPKKTYIIILNPNPRFVFPGVGVGVGVGTAIALGIGLGVGLGTGVGSGVGSGSAASAAVASLAVLSAEGSMRREGFWFGFGMKVEGVWKGFIFSVHCLGILSDPWVLPSWKLVTRQVTVMSCDVTPHGVFFCEGNRNRNQHNLPRYIKLRMHFVFFTMLSFSRQQG